ncbi:MAG: PA2169 family four-helix-bundle protein [Chloroflexi bacterium]|nr:PA2169 family four-helix-bundle protein [Chloroflexota bacterium]
MSNEQAVKTLNNLYKLCRAGERGFKTVAKNVDNRGLKVLLKTYAQQRRQFALDLKAIIEQTGGEVNEKRNIRGIIHRGRIDIVAALIIGPQNVENMVLKEALVGEKTVLAAYKHALTKQLPDKAAALIQNQLEAIQAANEQIERLCGRPDERLVVRLFDSDQDATKASLALVEAGFSENSIEAVDFQHIVDLQAGQSKSLDETMISGAVGGAIWGSLLGTASGAGLFLIVGLQPIGATTIAGTWALITLIGMLMGALFGILLGFVIGLSSSEEDFHLYGKSVLNGRKLVLLQTNRHRATEASQIMRQIELLQNSTVG